MCWSIPTLIAIPGERVLVVQIGDYAVLVPFVVDPSGGFFFKTIIPIRKATRTYLAQSTS